MSVFSRPSPGEPCPSLRRALAPGLTDAALRPQVRLDTQTHTHPPRTPGRYRPPARMARLLRLRAPRCEWPGCGAASVRCDLDHDVSHPDGPTCGCNLGPACRRHHRLKHLYLAKLRVPGGVLWTSPTGRRWLSPDQHRPPQAPVRPPPPLRDPHGPQRAEPADDADGIEPRHSPDPLTLDTEPTRDPFEHVDLRHGWGITLDDHTRWHR